MYNRILLKLSGEVLAGSSNCIEEPAVIYVANQIKNIINNFPNIEIAVVVGGGNIFRGKQNPYIERVKADYIGSIGTVINAMALSSALDTIEIENTVMTPFDLNVFCEKYNAFNGRKFLSQKKVVILGGGTGSPFFSTDTNAALRACELNCDLVVKATKVDGLYDKDPVKYEDATFIERTTYDKVIENKYDVMDITAFTLCSENSVPILICNLLKDDSVVKFLNGEKIGSIVGI